MQDLGNKVCSEACMLDMAIIGLVDDYSWRIFVGILLTGIARATGLIAKHLVLNNTLVEPSASVKIEPCELYCEFYVAEMFWLHVFLQLWYWQCFHPDEWKGSDQHIVPTVNQLRMAKNARTIGFRGGSSREWLRIGTRCELCALGDELKHNYWSKLQDDVKIVWFEGIIICLCCCVMILVNLCHNGLSMMYVEVTHTRRPR